VGTRILIADSFILARQEIAAFLKDCGFDICGEAENGKQAVEKALAFKPDIVLMDITMPGMGGFDAARDILQASPMAQIIILTIRSQPELVAEAKRVGARGYVSKGSAAAFLIEAIDAVSQGQTYFEAKPQL
jgi:DNA-binding NarL/FixJ family response regulator